MSREVKILGTTYQIICENQKSNKKLFENDGYCDTSVKKIVINDYADENDIDDKDDLEFYKQQILRHELIHAFFYESGLDLQSDYARNEELIDWLAIQLPKICKVMNELNI